MIYKLFTEFITLQALLKELGIIQSGGAIKGFLAETTVLFNGEDEKRRGKKIRVGDKISLPDQDLIITIVEPSQEEKEQFAEEMAEKTRVAALVKQMNQANKKTSSKHNNRQSTTKKSLRKLKVNQLHLSASQVSSMWIKELELKHYRNYDHLLASFSSGLNVFIGNNAQGKTNFLEAIYFLSLTRSHRTRADKELIHFDHSTVSLTGKIQRISGTVDLEINLSDKGRVTKINALKQAKLSDYIGTMMVVLFAPEDLQLVKGAPSLRRKFIDIDLGQIKPVYLSELSHYNHVLKQRNSYLKSAQQIDAAFLAVLDEQLASYGARVMEHRIDFINALEKEANTHHQAISNGLESLSLSYQSSVVFDKKTNIYQQFLYQLEKNHQKDFFRKNTSVGPHRDELAFYINGMNANFASQGQHRSLILSLKMAEVSLMKALTGDNPILLLDDVMSELDNTRQTKLLETVIKENVQTFITTTSLDHLSQLPEGIRIFHVTKGTVQIDSDIH